MRKSSWGKKYWMLGLAGKHWSTQSAKPAAQPLALATRASSFYVTIWRVIKLVYRPESVSKWRTKKKTNTQKKLMISPGGMKQSINAYTCCVYIYIYQHIYIYINDIFHFNIYNVLFIYNYNMDTQEEHKYPRPETLSTVGIQTYQSSAICIHYNKLPICK